MRRFLFITLLVGAFTIPPLISELFPRLPAADLVLSQRALPIGDFGFVDGSGRRRGLDEFRGQYLIVNVWATWCAPCRKEMPSLDRLEPVMSRKNTAVMAISIDVSGLTSVRSYFQHHDLENLKIYVDPDKSIMEALGITGIPTTLIIDPAGNEVGRVIGPSQWDAPESIETLSEIVSR